MLAIVDNCVLVALIWMEVAKNRYGSTPYLHIFY